MPPASPTKIPDCLSIAKAFERSASYAVTEESVFAMLGPVLDTTRIQTQGFIDQTDTLEALSSSQTSISQQAVSPNATTIPSGQKVNLTNLNNPADVDEDIFTTVGRNWTEPLVEGTGNVIDANTAGGIFNTSCIPCGQRLNMAGQIELEAGLSAYLDYWAKWLEGHYNNLLNMIKTFSISNKYVDICALLKFMSDFVCVPDLSRMLSALMALMERTAFEFNGVFDLIMQLVGPLLQPFLSNFFAMIERYILMIIKPLECIVEALQNLLRKLDYNVLFKNIEKLDKHISFGPKQGEVIGEAGPSQVKGIDFTSPTGRSENRALPFLGFMDVDLHKGPDRAFEADINLSGPASKLIKEQKAREQRAVETAADELRSINKAASQVDGANPEEMSRYMVKRKAAEQKLRDTTRTRDFTEIGKFNQTISDTTHGMKSSVVTLIGFLRKAAASVEGFFQDLFDELQKMMGQLLTGHGGFIQLLFEKLALVQMISWIASIIEAFQNGIKCDGDNPEDIKIENFLPQQSNLKFWTDDQGNLHIEEDPAAISNAIDQIVAVLGVVPASSKTLSTSPGPGAGGTTSSGGVSTGDKDVAAVDPTSSQKLKGLIEFTGNPVLDSSIARAVDTLTTAQQVSFKCPLQNTADQANQVSQWIKEVSTV